MGFNSVFEVLDYHPWSTTRQATIARIEMQTWLHMEVFIKMSMNQIEMNGRAELREQLR